MTDTPGTRAAAVSGLEHRVVEYGRVRSAQEAAAARNIELEALVKTLAVRLADGDYRLVAVPGDRSIDWPKLRSVVGVSRLSMADEDELVAITGYKRGTVTPFGASQAWPLIVDERLAHLEEVSIGGGAHGVAINLAGRDLATWFGATVADVTKPQDMRQ